MITAQTKLPTLLKMTHPCRCDSCENSCNFGSGALADNELERIAYYLDLTPDDAKEKYFEEVKRFGTTRLRPKLERKEGLPYGKCIFYEKEKGCLIHEVKPLECKLSMGCKDYGDELITWFHINHFLDKKNPESLRQFKIYLESGGKTLPGAEHKDIFDQETLKKLEEYEDLKDDTDWDEKLGIKDLMEKGDKK
jgi:Fe-S-cluster containining protein